MYDLVKPVQEWLEAGLPVTVARLVDTRGLSSRERAACLAITPGRPPVGALLAGSLDGPLLAAVSGPEGGRPGRVLTLTVSDADADRAGLSCGGQARVLIEPATAIPEEAWRRLAANLPVCLVTDLSADGPGPTTVLSPAARTRRHTGRRRAEPPGQARHQ